MKDFSFVSHRATVAGISSNLSKKLMLISSDELQHYALYNDIEMDVTWDSFLKLLKNSGFERRSIRMFSLPGYLEPNSSMISTPYSPQFHLKDFLEYLNTISTKDSPNPMSEDMVSSSIILK